MSGPAARGAAGKLAGKVALVTGGSRGIGRATAERFVAEGAQVVITGRNRADLDTAVKEIGGAITAVPCDASKLDELDRLFAAIRERHGRLDVLFANAGGGAFVPLGQITEEHFDRYFGLNVKGTLFTVQKALPLMPDGAAIVINASMVSVKGLPAFSVYSATKAAVRSFARTWSVDLRGRGIRVNVVSPGTIVTPGYRSELGLDDQQIAQLEAQASASSPLGRTGAPDEIAKAVVFLASDDASYITGVELFVDGGVSQI